MVPPLREVLQDPGTRNAMALNPNTFRFRDGASLVVAAEEWPPHVFFRPPADGTTDENSRLQTISGPMANMINILAEKLNFTYKLVQPEDGAWGSRLPNGSWTGMVGMVNRKEADLALGPFGRTENRAQAVDFTPSFFFDYRCILASKGTAEVDPWCFLYVLAPPLWIGLLGAGLAVWTAAMLLTAKPRGVCLGWRGVRTLFSQMQVITNQDVTWTTVGWSERAVLGGWVVVAAVVGWAYAGHLTSLLAVRRAPTPVQSLQDLLQRPDLGVSVKTDTVLAEAMAVSHKSRFWPGSLFDADLMHQVKRGEQVVVTTSLLADTLMAHDFITTTTCHFYKSRQNFIATNHCMIGQKGSPLTPLITSRVTGIVEAGLYKYWLAAHVPRPRECHRPPSSATAMTSLSLHNLWGMAVVLVGGLGLATAVFCIELVVGRRE
ncbi:glutamate receptor ionotropic, kainate 5-like isoform X2 [Eriocheir sinensis]|uniref:glutamate receptor ionotropic, kainate 5-like isoform X2 n=1 Tax=Eriocheir sinensis TaxID=95602 RepID=UPI0021C7149E|nr:glutamate receptor ionotropic, kainate 5-like isoform X2 [Eriocheir sinensis]